MARTIDRPAAAFALSLIGGIIVLVVGILVSLVGFLATIHIGGVGGIFGLIGVLWGLIMIISSFLMFAWPEQHTAWAILIIVASVLSWIGAFGGLFFGFLLGLIGGILGLIWKSEPPQGIYGQAGPPPV